MLAAPGAWLCLSSGRTTPSTGNTQSSPTAWSPAAPLQLVPGSPSCSPLAVLMKRIKSWWLFLPPEVSASAGGRNRQRWLVSLELWSPLPPGELWYWGAKSKGEKHSGAAGQGETAGAKFHFATSNNGGCAVAIPGRAVGLGLCSNSPSQGTELLGEERLGCIGHQCSNTGHSRGKGRLRDMLGRAGGCKSPQIGNK